jgi:hypothetical protein
LPESSNSLRIRALEYSLAGLVNDKETLKDSEPSRTGFLGDKGLALGAF